MKRLIVLWICAHVMCVAVLNASGQTDSDPANDVPELADMLLPADNSTAATVNIAAFTESGSDVDFYSTSATAGQVLFGIIAPLDGLPSEYGTPDTLMATFTSDGMPLTFNDDTAAGTSGIFGFSLGSLFRLEAIFEDDYRIGVTGYDDEDFDGFDDFTDNMEPHAHVGRYALTIARVDPFAPSGDFADTDPANDSIAGADAISVAAGGAAVSIAEFAAPGDIDYFQLDLRAGDLVSAMTAPLGVLPKNFGSPDTMLGLFDSGGELLVSNDDAGFFDEADDNPDIVGLASDNPSISRADFAVFGSALHAQALVDGTYFLGATGFGDDGYLGNHAEVGQYALLVSIIPEPDKENPNASDQIEHFFNFGSSGDGDGQFLQPAGITVDDDGNIYVTDRTSHRVQVFDETGALQFQFGSEGSGEGQFLGPFDIEISEDAIYVADHDNQRVQIFDRMGVFQSEIGSLGGTPRALGLDGDGNVYVDDGNNRIHVFDNAGALLFDFGGEGSGSGQLAFPRGIAVDDQGQIYVVEADNHRVQVFDETGVSLFSFGELGSENGQFLSPFAIDIGDDGNLYVMDTGNNRVQVFNSSGSYLDQFGVGGITEARLNDPWGIAVDGDRIYVANTGNDRVEVFQTVSVATFPGDYNNNGLIEQGDLDLVLLNWGSDIVPDTWLNDLPTGAVDQGELDKVLLGWGNAAPVAAAAVPEPTTLGVLLVAALALAIQWCSKREFAQGGKQPA